jgi:hypothetical protein
MLRLVRTGEEKRVVEIHLHWHLLADVLTELSRTLSIQPLDPLQREALSEAATALHAALTQAQAGTAAAPACPAPR